MILLSNVTTNTGNGGQGSLSTDILLLIVIAFITFRIIRLNRNRKMQPSRFAFIIMMYSFLAYSTILGAPTLNGYLYYMLGISLIIGVYSGYLITQSIEFVNIGGEITYRRPFVLSITFLVLFSIREVTLIIINQPWILSYLAIAIFVSLGLIIGEFIVVLKKSKPTVTGQSNIQVR
ncbi:MAG: hypothetical protein ACYDAO_03850 [Thermoplasmataceae archaeon]